MRLFAGKRAIYYFGYLARMLDSKQRIDFGHFIPQFVAKTLRKTANYNYRLTTATLLILQRLVDCLYGLLLGTFNKPACIDDYHISM